MVAGARCIALKVDTRLMFPQAHSVSYRSPCRLYNLRQNRPTRLSFVVAKYSDQDCNRNYYNGDNNNNSNNNNNNNQRKNIIPVDNSLRVCEWQSSCAILNSQLLHAKQLGAQKEDESNAALINPSQEIKNGSGIDLKNNKISPRTEDGITGISGNATANVSNALPRPLSISDLAARPMHGSELRVAYQGVPGAYSEAAAGKAYPKCEAIPCDQFEAAFQAVELWVADRAVLPVENSLGGSIHRNYDLLLRHRLHIVGEVQLPVHHCLLGLPGTRKEDLKRVISHPQALAQCELTLTSKLGLKVVREAVDDTAGAAQYVAENYIRDTAAIASARAADIYGLNVIADGIQDDTSNVTRFVMLAREPIIPRADRPFKTSIVFAHDEGTGNILFKVLSAFAFRDINLTKIESRPQRNRPLRVVDDSNLGTAKYFEYLFYIDFEASMADPRAQNALAELQEFTNFLRVLGSYPMDMSPLGNSGQPIHSSSP